MTSGTCQHLFFRCAFAMRTILLFFILLHLTIQCIAFCDPVPGEPGSSEDQKGRKVDPRLTDCDTIYDPPTTTPEQTASDSTTTTEETTSDNNTNPTKSNSKTGSGPTEDENTAMTESSPTTETPSTTETSSTGS